MVRNLLLFCLLFVNSLSAEEKSENLHFVSFIIPCYNCEKTIEESIESIYQQKLNAFFEVICVDDCSTDNTKLILEQCAHKFPNLLVYAHDRNKGGGATRNTCTLYAKGDLIFNLDSDNVLVPNSINKLIDLIDQTGCDIASFHYARFFEENYVEVNKWIYSWEDNVVDLYKLLKNENSFPAYQGNYLYTRKCFDLVKGYPKDCGALDTTAFGLSLLAAGCKIAIHPDPETFYWHRTNENSYWNREHLNNAVNFQKSLGKLSEVFAEEFLDVLSDKQKADECLKIWAKMEFKLASPSILEALFKAYQYKKEKQYHKAAKEFSNAIECGCKSEKIHQNMQEMINLNNQIKQAKLSCSPLNAKERPSSFVTYALDGGRFGDQLINYMKALWVSCKYEIPLLYQPFDYSDQLELSKAHVQVLDSERIKNIRKVEIKENLKFLEEKIDHTPTLYLISFYSQVLSDEDWENEAFRKKLAELIKPKKHIKSIRLPSDYLTIAIHVRSKNNSFDTPLDIEQMPTKFPPHSFYMNGLKQVANHFKGQPLYVYIFTDDPYPQIIRDKYTHELKNWKIENKVIINCRESKNDYDINVLEDFFDMMQFDCIIHPDSMFSLSACILSGPIVEVTPSSWNVCRKDEENHILKDKEGNVIVDNLLYFRPEKGKPISQTRFAPIEKDMLF